MRKRKDIVAQLEELEAMDLEQLRDAWRRRCRSAPPAVKSGLLRLALAYRLQEKAFGGLTNATRRQLRETVAIGQPRSSIRPGMRLMRVWKGTTHVVTMGEEGVIRWNGREWRSLSQVARAITGTHWSGPAFFGFRAKRDKIT
ncbi:DUF2924 domain-containing protein [Nitratireductor sp. GCM10026969]|uniref:DUF2924 domain-containing protein n=1 Tax=Nitratireductor sp. GCM10026969 TaxID=3252645 RepID=UPI003624404D